MTPNACAIAAQGTLVGGTIRWSRPLLGYRTDGVVTCRGSLCGKAGAPPPGETVLHLGPGPVWFRPFDFAADMRTFTMTSTQVSKTESPKLTASIALAGREIRRRCVQVQPCPWCGARGATARLRDQATMSKRSRFITFVHATTKSRTNFSCASQLP